MDSSGNSSVCSNNISRLAFKFLKEDSLPPEFAGFMNKAFEICTTLEADVDWVTEEDCLSLHAPLSRTYFVVSHFSGPAFNALNSINQRLFGPLCIIIAYKHSTPLLKMPHPVYQPCMRGVLATCSQIEKNQRAALCQKIQWMGGSAVPNLVNEVTHVVCPEAGSKKYKVAAQLKKTIVTPAWVEEAWKHGYTQELDATDPTFCNQFLLPIFSGLKASVSGLALEERKMVEDAFVANGGMYNGDMRIGECTHLITNAREGAKYKAAKSWNIKIVTVDWVLDSVETGYTQDEELYKVPVTNSDKQKPKASTPENEKSKKHSVFGRDLNCSAILPDKSHNNRFNTTTISNASTLLDPSVTNTTCVNETKVRSPNLNSTRKSTRSTSKTPSPKNSKNNSKDGPFLRPAVVTVTARSRKRPEQRQSTVTGGTAVTSSSISLMPDDLDLTINTTGDFMNNCQVYIAPGFERTMHEKLRKMVHAGGGVVVMKLTSALTHVIVASADSNLQEFKKLQEKICKSSYSSHVTKMVGADWLIQSFRGGRLLPETNFEIRPEANTTSANTTLANNNDSESPVVPAKRNRTDKMSMLNLPASRGRCDEDLASQYMPSASTANVGDSTLLGAMCVLDDANFTTTKETVKLDGVPEASLLAAAVIDVEMQEEEPRPDEHQSATSKSTMSEDVLPVFSGLNFLLCNFNETEFAFGVQQAEQDILNNGGNITGSNNEVDIVLVPNLDRGTFTVPNSKAEQIRTYFWMKRCIEENAFLAVEGHELFLPIKINAKMKPPLEGVVLTISQINGIERELMTWLAIQMGARVQESFTRKKRDELLPNTHLMVNQKGGQKYDAAVKWKIHIVNKRWLIECVKTGRRQSEELYPSFDADKSTTASGLPVISPRADSAFLPKNMNSTPLSTSKCGDVLCDGSAERLPIGGLTPLNNRVNQLKIESDAKNVATADNNKTRISSSLDSSFDPTALQWDTPSKFADPNVSFHPKFDLKDAMEYLKTPESEKRRRDESMDLGAYFDQQIRIAAVNMENAVAVYTPHRSPILPARDFTTARAAGPVIGDSLDSCQTTSSKFTPALQHGPLTGVILAVSKKLSGHQKELNEIVRKLGGKYVWTNEDSATHFVFQGRTNDTSREFRQARDSGKFIVAPAWLYACLEDNARVDEALYPHIFNAQKQQQFSSARKMRSTKIGVVAGSSQSSQSANGDLGLLGSQGTKIGAPEPKTRTAIVHSTATTSAGEGAEPSFTPKKTNSEATTTASDPRMNLNAFLSKILPKSGVVSPKADVNNVAESLPPFEVDFSEVANEASNAACASDANNSGSVRKTSSSSKLNFDLKDKDDTSLVGWEDPYQRKERERIGGLSRQKDEQTQILEYNLPHVADRQNSENSENIDTGLLKSIQSETSNKDIKIVLTALPKEEKEHYAGVVKRLGGILLESNAYEPQSTHLVTGGIARNEKILGSMASGKWILHKSYLDDCAANGYFVEEKLYEWISMIPELDGSKERLARACHRWRNKLEKTAKCAYEGWNVLLFADRTKESGLKRLLEAGGATVKTCPVAKVPRTQKFTHAFVDVGKVNFSQSDFKVLKTMGIQCFRVGYIAGWLEDDPLKEKDYEIAFT